MWSYTIGGSAAAAKVDPLAGGNGDSVAMDGVDGGSWEDRGYLIYSFNYTNTRETVTYI